MPLYIPRYYLNAKHIIGRIPGTSKLKLRLADFQMQFLNGLLSLARNSLYNKLPGSPDRILIFRTGSLGDSLCAIPAIRSISAAYPKASIDILTNAGKKNLIGLGQLLPSDGYREIIDYYGYSKKILFKLLKQKKYDLVIQLPQVDAGFLHLLRDLFFFRLIARAGFGWHLSQSKWFRKTQARYLRFSNEISRLQWLLYKESAIKVGQEKSILKPSIEDLEFVNKFISDASIHNTQGMLAIVVGAKRSQNRWPMDYFKKITEHFSTTYTIILIGSSEDNILVENLANIKNVLNTCGKFTPLQSAAAMSLCELTISNDTGPMHLSYAVGTPTIALFSSRDLPGKWYPPEGTNYVFRKENVHCEACFSEVCNNNICMQAILPEEVIELAEQVLKNDYS
jgi:ADP-heptose:LPS heptosyltransferase